MDFAKLRGIAALLLCKTNVCPKRGAEDMFEECPKACPVIQALNKAGYGDWISLPEIERRAIQILDILNKYEEDFE